jgi:uncharacterized protein YdaU (DUF1376 family)
MNWYKFNIPEFYEKIGDGLTVEEELIYRKLIDLYYLNDGPLPDNLTELVDAIGMSNEQMVEHILEFFFSYNLEDKVWYDKAIDRDLMNRKHQVSINRKIGQKGGRPKSTKT